MRFAHRAPRDAREHERFFGAPLRFATGENALVLPVALSTCPVVAPDPSLLSLLDRYAADRLGEPRAATFADRARAALSEELQAGNVTAHGLAARLKVSVRTLHRTLAAEGTSYRRLLDQLRLDTAERHLLDDRVSVAEVAFLVGFSELSAFHRAFKRWTGSTPSAFRAEARLRRGLSLSSGDSPCNGKIAEGATVMRILRR